MALLKHCFSPIRRMVVGLRLQAMRRRLPHVHRGWVRTGRGAYGIRPETDVEYLDRLVQRVRTRATGA
jgi:hypothetical protein